LALKLSDEVQGLQAIYVAFEGLTQRIVTTVIGSGFLSLAQSDYKWCVREILRQKTPLERQNTSIETSGVEPLTAPFRRSFNSCKLVMLARLSEPEKE